MEKHGVGTRKYMTTHAISKGPTANACPLAKEQLVMGPPIKPGTELLWKQPPPDKAPPPGSSYQNRLPIKAPPYSKPLAKLPPPGEPGFPPRFPSKQRLPGGPFPSTFVPKSSQPTDKAICPRYMPQSLIWHIVSSTTSQLSTPPVPVVFKDNNEGFLQTPPGLEHMQPSRAGGSQPTPYQEDPKIMHREGFGQSGPLDEIQIYDAASPWRGLLNHTTSC